MPRVSSPGVPLFPSLPLSLSLCPCCASFSPLLTNPINLLTKVCYIVAFAVNETTRVAEPECRPEQQRQQRLQSPLGQLQVQVPVVETGQLERVAAAAAVPPTRPALALVALRLAV